MLKVTWRGLVAHKLRFLLTAVAVVLGVSFVVGTLVLTDTVKQTFNDLFSGVYKGTDAFVRSRSSLESDFGPEQRAPVPESLLSKIQNVDGVKGADGNVQIDRAQYLGRDGKPVGNPAQGAPTLGFNWSATPQLNAFTLVEYRGRSSHEPRGPDEVVIDKGTADEERFGIGDRVTVLFNNLEIPQAEFTVVGVVTFGGADRPAGATAALFTTPRAQVLDNSVGKFDAISVAGDGVSQADLATRIRGELPRTYQVLTGEQIIKENQTDLEKNLSFFTIALLVFAYISLFVGAFIIVNTFSIVVAQRTRELALLRALGASGRQVRASVIGEALGVGTIASVIGIGTGIGTSAGLKSLLASFGLDLPPTSLVVKPGTIITGLVVGIGVTLLSSLLPARRAARVAPMAAIRDVAVEQRDLGRRTVVGVVIAVAGVAAMLVGLFGGAGVPLVGLGALTLFLGVAVLGPVIARPVGRFLGAPIRRWRGMAGTLAQQNAVRNPRRTASTAAALMIGIALVGFIAIFASSTKASVSAQIDRAFRADYVVLTAGGGFGGSFSPKLAEDLQKLPEVGVAGALRFGPLKVLDKSAFLTASDPRTMDAIFDINPRRGDLATLGPDDIAVSSAVFKDNKWRLGQEIATQFPIGGTQKMRIGAVYGFGQKEGLSDYFISTAAFDQRYTSSGDNQVYIKVANGTSIAAAKPALEKVVKQYPGTELTDRTGLRERFEGQVNQLLAMIVALLGLALVIAVIGIMNTLLLSIVERTREIGLLRAVGMTRRQVRTSVRWESVIVAVFGALLGITVGIFFGWAIVKALHDEGITEFAIPIAQLLGAVVFAALAGVLAATYPAHRAARLDVLDAISTE